jgi:hypothetical protein
MRKPVIIALCFVAATATALCQQGTSSSQLVSRSTTAIGYPVGGGSTKVDLRSTSSIPQANGEAEVEAKQGVTNIEAKVRGLVPASKLGTELLTYVLWAVSPDGRTSNLGEIQINNSGEGELKATVRSGCGQACWRKGLHRAPARQPATGSRVAVEGSRCGEGSHRVLDDGNVFERLDVALTRDRYRASADWICCKQQPGHVFRSEDSDHDATLRNSFLPFHHLIRPRRQRAI